MATKRNTSLDRVLGRLDQLDTINLTNLVQRLARERGLFEDIFNVLQEGVLVIDMEGVIAYANAAAQRLIGLGAEDELAGQTLWAHGSRTPPLARCPHGGRCRPAGHGPGIRAHVSRASRGAALYGAV